MSKSDSSSPRFRPASEFPKNIDNLQTEEANKLYQEMRDCLIFTNRSRGQLLRRNQEYKNSTANLKSDVERLQSLIHQLSSAKQQDSQGSQQTIQALENELQVMTSHLDQLSEAFDLMGVNDPEQAKWGLVTAGRFYKFWNAIFKIVLWWREENNNNSSNTTLPSSAVPLLQSEFDVDEDRKDRPQMYDDQASIGRSLLDK